MHVFHPRFRLDLERTTKSGKGLLAAIGHRMAHHQFIGSRAFEVQGDFITHSIGADIVERRIQHSGHQGIDLHIAGAKVIAMGTG